MIYIISNLELYRVFYHTALEGNVTKAAHKLFITQPSASHAIKQLEKQLELPLFVRKSKGVTLTEEGKLLLRYVEQAFANLETAERKLRDMKNLNAGQIRLGASDSLCKHFLLPYLQQFRVTYPDIQIQLSHGKTPDITQRLSEGRIDCGLVHLPVDDNLFEIRKSMEIVDGFVAGDAFSQLAGEAEITLEELMRHPLILLSPTSSTRRFLQAFAEAQGLTLQPEIEVGSIDLLIEFAKAGLGISFITKAFVGRELNSGELFEVKLKKPVPPRRIGLITLADAPLSVAAEAFAAGLPF